MKRAWLGIALVGALVGCQIVETDPARVELLKVKNVNEIELERASANERFDVTHKPMKLIWFQPSNHRQQCHILGAMPQEGIKMPTIYWEGDCRDGKAVGIGRYVAFANKKVISDSVLNFQQKSDTTGQMDFWFYEPTEKRIFVGAVNYKMTGEYTIKKFFYRFLPNQFATHDVYAATEVSDQTQNQINTVFMASDNPQTITYFKHNRGVVDSLNVITNVYKNESFCIDMYDRNSRKQMGVSHYHINGPDWTKTYSIKHSNKQSIELPDGYWETFLKRFDGMKEESEAVIRLAKPIAQKAHSFMKSYCQKSKVTPDGIARDDYWNLCQVNPALFNVGFEQLWLQNPNKYPILKAEHLQGEQHK